MLEGSESTWRLGGLVYSNTYKKKCIYTHFFEKEKEKKRRNTSHHPLLANIIHKHAGPTPTLNLHALILLKPDRTPKPPKKF